jgi:hypothetical protein
MLGSSILDVAIGMAFIYLLLSLIASTVQEALASIVQTRSANLEHGIRSLFSGGTMQNGELFVDAIYRHGLVRGLYRDPVFDYPRVEGPRTRPQEFYRRLRRISQSVRKTLRTILRLFLGVRASPTISEVSDPFLLPAYIPARTFAITLMDLLTKDLPGVKPVVDELEDKLHALSKQVHGPHGIIRNMAAEAMLALLADAGKDAAALGKFRCNLENWYNDAMDRVSGWYKKYTQKILLVIGLLLAITFNVDSVRLGRTLWFDKDARQGLVNAAGTYVEKNTPAAAPDAPSAKDGLRNQMEKTVTAFNEVSSQYLLPVGWKHSFKEYKVIFLHPEDWNVIHILEQLLGWLITAFALSLGAPFWFDALNKFMVVRSTIKPQEKSRNEGSKD